jgi:hypothetical protein
VTAIPTEASTSTKSLDLTVRLRSGRSLELLPKVNNAPVLQLNRGLPEINDSGFNAGASVAPKAI